jgi:hypothetical protein
MKTSTKFSDGRAKSFEEETLSVADDTPVSLPVVHPVSFEEETFVEDEQSYMDYTVADHDTFQRQQQQLYDCFEEEAFAEENQSYMEYAVADDTPQRQQQQSYDSFEEERPELYEVYGGG